jgi:hypothetical protein
MVTNILYAFDSITNDVCVIFVSGLCDRREEALLERLCLLTSVAEQRREREAKEVVAFERDTQAIALAEMSPELREDLERQERHIIEASGMAGSVYTSANQEAAFAVFKAQVHEELQRLDELMTQCLESHKIMNSRWMLMLDRIPSKDDGARQPVSAFFGTTPPVDINSPPSQFRKSTWTAYFVTRSDWRAPSSSR